MHSGRIRRQRLLLRRIEEGNISTLAPFFDFSICSSFGAVAPNCCLILGRKLLQRPGIVYQNDKMESSSVPPCTDIPRSSVSRFEGKK